MPLAALPGLDGVFAGTRPDNLGVQQGELAACPSSPNCVSSQAEDDHAIAPLTYSRDHQAAQATLVKILQNQPRTQIIEQRPDYVYAEFASRLMGFVDDAEFYFPSDTKTIEVRSAARLGESDLGVNRRRLEQIRLALQELGA
ncbi:MAG: DUF1499 domain-containing protein [Leptolyngbya sp. SIO4C1]|nr:DUF1499 domain-containing protein [Leptolyngbya sp. SIO4C1]